MPDDDKDDPAGGSPTSDRTLVDFEEDVIYFKPAFSPEALSPIPEDEDAPPMSPATLTPGGPRPEALSLQIAMELLTDELDGTTRRDAGRGAGVARVLPLQTWVMIEAYEKLRGQVLGMHMPKSEALALTDMFDVWLRALYRVHEGLIYDGEYEKKFYAPSEHKAEVLETVELD